MTTINIYNPFAHSKVLILEGVTHHISPKENARVRVKKTSVKTSRTVIEKQGFIIKSGSKPETKTTNVPKKNNNKGDKQ